MGSGTISLFCSKCFSPFLHSTCSLSVSQEYLALPDGPGQFGQDSSCPDLLRIPICRTDLRVRGCHPLSPLFPKRSTSSDLAIARSYYPDGAETPPVWAAPRSLAATGGITFCFLLLQVLRCFSSLRLPTLRYNTSSMYWVVPFGNPRVKGHLHLYAAYRSLSRPSSPLRAKASTIRPWSFTLIIFQLTRYS